MKAGKNKRLVQNFFSLGFVQVINSSLQLLVIPYVIKTIGADGFGVVAVAQVVMFYLSTFTEYGFSQTATRNVAIARDDHEKIAEIFYRVFFSKLILCCIAFILLLVLVYTIPIFATHRSLYLIGFVFVIGQSLLINWFFQGMEKMWFIALTTLVARVLFVLLVFLFMKTNNDGFLFLFFLGGGNIIAAALSIVIACSVFKLKFIKPRRADILKELKEGWHFTLTNLSMNTCQYANVFILRFFTNDLLVGYYSIAERIFFAVKQVLVIFSQSVYPAVCLMVKKGENLWNSFVKRIYTPFFLCVLAGAILLVILSPWVLYFFSSNESVYSVFFLQMLSIILVIVCLNIPSTLALLAMNKKKSYFRIYVFGGILNILSNIILAYFFKGTGTIIAIFITEIFITAGVIYESSRLRLFEVAKQGLQNE